MNQNFKPRSKATVWNFERRSIAQGRSFWRFSDKTRLVRKLRRRGGVAQWLEHRTHKPGVSGSNPLAATNNKFQARLGFFYWYW